MVYLGFHFRRYGPTPGKLFKNVYIYKEAFLTDLELINLTCYNILKIKGAEIKMFSKEYTLLILPITFHPPFLVNGIQLPLSIIISKLFHY